MSVRERTEIQKMLYGRMNVLSPKEVRPKVKLRHEFAGQQALEGCDSVAVHFVAPSTGEDAPGGLPFGLQASAGLVGARGASRVDRQINGLIAPMADQPLLLPSRA
jgi:hypothetical protein